MSTHVATFSEILKKCVDPTKKYFWKYVFGTLLIALMWFAIRIISSILFGIAGMHEVPLALAIVFLMLGFICSLLAYIAQYLFTLFPLVMILQESRNVATSLKKSFSFLWRSILVSAWVFIRSYAWLVLIGLCVIGLASLMKGQGTVIVSALGALVIVAGVIISCFFFPRFSFAFILMIQENMSPRVCVRESYARTNGYWGKIVGNGILLGLIFLGLFILFAGAGFLVSLVVTMLMHSGSMIVATVVGLCFGVIIGCAFLITLAVGNLFGVVFRIKLYEAIHAHPIHRKMKKA